MRKARFIIVTTVHRANGLLLDYIG